MNLPNKLTVLRVFMIPVFVYTLMYAGGGDIRYRYAAFIIFVLASLTDTLDGYIARKYKLITNFGKLMDPLADKVLVCAALICFVELGELPAWIVIVVISREFIISGIRLVAADAGVVIAASNYGKIKTVVQMICVIYMLSTLEISYIKEILVYAMLILTVVSLVDYVVKNIALFKGGER